MVYDLNLCDKIVGTSIINTDKTTLQTLYVTAQWKLVLYQLNSNNFSSLLQRVDAPHLLRYIQSL